MKFTYLCTDQYADSRIFTVDSDFRVYQKHGDTPIPVLTP